MAISFDKVKAGDVLYDVHSQKVGSTTMRAQGTWKVYVREVDTEKRRVLVSWNGNAAEWRPEAYLRSLRTVPPEWIKSDPFCGRKCYFCGKIEADGHSETCEHPRAKRKVRP